MANRPTNQELCSGFRKLLTEGFYVVDLKGQRCPDDGAVENGALAMTMPWRNELWKAFRELENRLDPIGAMDRERKTKA